MQTMLPAQKIIEKGRNNTISAMRQQHVESADDHSSRLESTFPAIESKTNSILQVASDFSSAVDRYGSVTDTLSSRAIQQKYFVKMQ